MDKIAIDKFKKDIRFRHKIAHVETIPGKIATFKEVNNLNDKIARYLKDEDIHLYEHQAQAYDEIKNGNNIIITTPTASGKTLAFNLPVLDTLSSNKDATALYIYPAKALSNDQLNVLSILEKNLNINIKPATYDGDTEKSERYGIRQSSRVILTNPYQLHHILAWHHQWKRFYSNLKYIIIDEAHYYKGIFGSNVAYLIRRLKRIANFYGSKPQFILSSATLANPKELASKLVGENFHLIDKDTSPSGEKDFIFYNPFYKNIKKNTKDKNNKDDNEALLNKNNNKINRNNTEDQFIEDRIANTNNSDQGSKIADGLSIHQETENIFLYLLLKDIQTLCFTVSRKIAELIAMWAKKDMLAYKRRLADNITAYRAGYLANERREIEEGLKSRKYLGVTCTNALELGINIGSLDAVIISGYPGTMISTWQQAGRAGRENQKSLVILLAFENQLDQYFMNNPRFFFDKPHENAIVDLNNEIIASSHVICAANELPIANDEAENIFNIHDEETGNNYLNKLIENEDLVENSRGQYIYPYDDQPSFNHSLDQLSTDIFKVMNNNQLLEIMERSQVYREAHEGAVLINKGETYIVDSVNLKNKYVNVFKRATEYHTIVLKTVDINIRKKLKRKKIGDFTVNFGELEVSEDFFKYKKMHFSKTIGTYFLDLPPLKFKTKGIWFTIPKVIKDSLEKKFDQDDVFAGGLHGVEHALIGLFPLHVMCDRFDIGGLSTNYHEDTQEATIFIYDAYEGGIGITEKAMEVFTDLIDSTTKLIDTCQCSDGCPACIYSPKCGNENKPLHKDATSYILNYIQEQINNDSNIAISSTVDKIKDDIGLNDSNVTNINNQHHNVNDKINKAINVNDKINNSINVNDKNNKGINVNDKINKGINVNDKININKSININDSKTKYEEAVSLFEEGNYTYAKDILVEIINEDKQYSNAWYLLGVILELQEDYLGASNFLKKALIIDPTHENAYLLLEKLKNQAK
ncbi:DEAD/DEAH box helicase [Methanobrevibacter cuticularis]|nr:DEAD/DEAH box helicase [Methanobrevibacter cuticularis]